MKIKLMIGACAAAFLLSACGGGSDEMTTESTPVDTMPAPEATAPADEMGIEPPTYQEEGAPVEGDLTPEATPEATEVPPAE